MREKFFIGEISAKLKINERMTRKLLNDAGVHVNELLIDPYPDEEITRAQVIDLFVDRAGMREGRLLADLLKG